MKITKTNLRKVVLEELAAVMDEDYAAMTVDTQKKKNSPEEKERAIELELKKDLKSAIIDFDEGMRFDMDGVRKHMPDKIMNMILDIAKDTVRIDREWPDEEPAVT